MLCFAFKAKNERKTKKVIYAYEVKMKPERQMKDRASFTIEKELLALLDTISKKEDKSKSFLVNYAIIQLFSYEKRRLRIEIQEQKRKIATLIQTFQEKYPNEPVYMEE